MQPEKQNTLNKKMFPSLLKISFKCIFLEVNVPRLWFNKEASKNLMQTWPNMKKKIK